jgi:DEAD/DEAH box helicase domain-containing protein
MSIVFFDLETQHLYQELGTKDSTKLKLAVAGILSNKEHLFFEEDQVQDLFKNLTQADLIVGHNILRFDYSVLKPYIKQDIVKTLQNKTFDTMLELEKVTRCWTSLDDLAKRNLGMAKSVDTLKIPEMWRNGKHQEVKDYLLNDLKMTEAVFNHGKNVGKFKYEHKNYGKSLGEREVSVKW